jgi:hypothetical protein
MSVARICITACMILGLNACMRDTETPAPPNVSSSDSTPVTPSASASAPAAVTPKTSQAPTKTQATKTQAPTKPQSPAPANQRAASAAKPSVSKSPVSSVPAAKAPATKAPATQAPVAAAPVAKSPAPAPPAAKQVPAPAAAATLDLTGLEQQLKSTKAIGVFSKIALKNQVDDLMKQFRDHYKGKEPPTMMQLRSSYDLLIMKVLSMVQDHDQKLAAAIVSSRSAIWDLLADPKKFATLDV